ncbi:unnamed protein product [Scytosiphon promiscuus]
MLSCVFTRFAFHTSPFCPFPQPATLVSRRNLPGTHSRTGTYARGIELRRSGDVAIQRQALNDRCCCPHSADRLAVPISLPFRVNTAKSMIAAAPSRPSSWRQRSFSRAACVVTAVAAVVASTSVAAALPSDPNIALSASSSTHGDDDFFAITKGRLEEPQRQQQRQQQQQQLEKSLAVVVLVSDVEPALRRIASWSTTCREGVAHPVDLILYLDNDEAHTRFNLETDSGGQSASELLDTLACFRQVTAVTGNTIYQIFTDTSVSQHFDEYDAITVVDWEHVEVLEGSFASLYRAAFYKELPQESWWLMAADAPPVDARGARERRRQLLESNFLHREYDVGDDMTWAINGKAVIYNNRSPELRRFLTRDVSPLLHDLPFDVALWATISFSPSIDNRWGGIMFRVVSIDSLVVNFDTEKIISADDRPIFLDIGSTGVQKTPFNTVDSKDIKASHAGQEGIAAAAADGGDRDPPHDQAQARPNAREAGNVRRKHREHEEHDQQSQELGKEEQEREESLNQELAVPGSLLTGSGVPFTDDITRGNLCVFVPGYLHQRSFAEVTVESVLHFMPGVRVAIAVDPSEMDDYQQSMGSLPDVVVTRSIDVKFSAVTADLRCGDDTELVLYLEPGTLLSRPFTKEDTHHPVTGELLVVMNESPASAGPRHETFAASAGEILAARNLPAFTAGTDLILPASVNRDVRDKLTLRESKSADWRIRFYAMEHHCFESDVHVPQILASMAFVQRVPGVKFVSREPADHGVDNGATRFDYVDSVEAKAEPLVLKPRFGCQVYSEVYFMDDHSISLVLGRDDLLFLDNGEQRAPQSLRAMLERFVSGEETCTSGLARLPWSTLMSPGASDAFGGGDVSGGGAGADSHGSGDGWGEHMYEGFHSFSSALPSADIGLYDNRLGCRESGPCSMDQFGAAIPSSEAGHHSVSSAVHQGYDFDLLNGSASGDDDSDPISYFAAESRAAAIDHEPAGSFYSTFEVGLNDDNNDLLLGGIGNREPLSLVERGGSSVADAAAIAAISAANRAAIDRSHYPAPSTSTYTTQWAYDNESPSFAADQAYGLAAYATTTSESEATERQPAGPAGSALGLELDDDSYPLVRASEPDHVRLVQQERSAGPSGSALGRELDDDFYPLVGASKPAPVRVFQHKRYASDHIAAFATASSSAAADEDDAHGPSYDDDDGFVVETREASVSPSAREADNPKAAEANAIAVSSTDLAPAADADTASVTATIAATTGSTGVARGKEPGALGGVGHLRASDTSTDEKDAKGDFFPPMGSSWFEILVDAVRRTRAALS